jgi:hypothetical protein
VRRKGLRESSESDICCATLHSLAQPQTVTPIETQPCTLRHFSEFLAETKDLELVTPYNVNITNLML